MWKGQYVMDTLLKKRRSLLHIIFQIGDATFSRRMQWNKVPESDVEDDIDRLFVFKYQRQLIGTAGSRMLTDLEYKEVMTYILLNCLEVQPYIV